MEIFLLQITNTFLNANNHSFLYFAYEEIERYHMVEENDSKVEEWK